MRCAAVCYCSSERLGLAPPLREMGGKCWVALPCVLLPCVLPASSSPCVSVSAACQGETRCSQKSKRGQLLMPLSSMISALCAVLTDLFIEGISRMVSTLCCCSMKLDASPVQKSWKRQMERALVLGCALLLVPVSVPFLA